MDKFYAVRIGRRTGVFASWDECQKQVRGYSGARFKSFKTRAEALRFLTAPAKTAAPPTQPRDIMRTTLRIYCDGACSANGGKRARAAIGVYFGAGDPRNLSERMDPGKYRQTNQAAELLAAVRALEAVAKGATAEVVTDSAYVVKGMNEWRHAWKQSGRWNRFDKLANFELWHRLDALAAAREVTFTWVKGHGTDAGNIAADRLATAALEEA
jgi:ribonuclease HI